MASRGPVTCTAMSRSAGNRCGGGRTAWAGIAVAVDTAVHEYSLFAWLFDTG